MENTVAVKGLTSSADKLNKILNQSYNTHRHVLSCATSNLFFASDSGNDCVFCILIRVQKF